MKDKSIKITNRFHTAKALRTLGLVLNNAFSWENQVNLICRRVNFALRRLWSTASYTPVRTRRKLALSLVVYSTTSAGLRHKLQMAFNSCARYVYGVSRRDHISDYANSLLGIPLGKFFSFRIWKQYYLEWRAGLLAWLDPVWSLKTLGRNHYTSPQLHYNSSLILCSWSYLVEWSAAVSKRGRRW
jgi:hypothetical protein